MAIRHIVRKDLMILARDRRALVVLVMLPMVFIAILGLSTGQMMGWRDDNTKLKIVLVDDCHDAITAGLVERLNHHATIELQTADTSDAAHLLVNDGDCMAAIHLTTDMPQRIEAVTLSDILQREQGALRDGIESLAVDVYHRPTQVMAGTLCKQIVFLELLQVILPEVAKRNPLTRVLLAQATATTQPADKHESTATTKDDTVNYGSMVYQVIVPSYTVLFAFFLVNIMARSFLAEAANGTLRRLCTAPIRTHQILIGKTVPFFIVSVIQAVALFVCGRLLFGMTWGPEPWLLIPVLVCTSLAATGLGLLTAVLVRSDAQVSAYANLVVIGLAGLSGCFMPRQWLPEAMRDISLAIPHAWALIGYDQILNSPQPNLTRIAMCCGMLIAFGTTFFLLGAWRFKRIATA